MQDAHQKQPRQESFAGAALAEHSDGTLDQLIQVQAKLGVHIQGVPDPEVPVIFPSEYQLHVPLGCLIGPGEMGGDGLGRRRTLGVSQGRRHGQRRQDRDGAVGDSPLHHLGDERVVNLGWGVAQPGVGTAQGYFRDDTEETVFAALNGDEGAYLDVLYRRAGVQAHLNATAQRTLHHQTQQRLERPIGLPWRIFHRIASVPAVGHGAILLRMA